MSLVSLRLATAPRQSLKFILKIKSETHLPRHLRRNRDRALQDRRLVRNFSKQNASHARPTETKLLEG